MVGRTPLLEIFFRRAGQTARVFAKYEPLNLTGSVKDRMALHILQRAAREGLLREGDEIVEASSGNTAISFAAMGRALGHKVRIFMPDWMSAERVAILRSFGAELHHVSAAEGGFIGSVAKAHEYADSHANTFAPLQFENPANVDAHALTTAPEIRCQLAALGLTPDAVVAGVGTGGTIMGLRRGLAPHVGDLHAHPLEPAESPVLTVGKKVGQHRIQGISDEFVPAIVDLGRLSAPVAVSDGDAILMAQKLSRELGLGVGISSGANLIGAMRLLDVYGVDATVVTLLPDSNKKYLSTDLFRDEPVKPGYVTPDVELLSYRAIPCPNDLGT